MMTFPVKSGMSSRLNLLLGGNVCETIEVRMPMVSFRRDWGRKVMFHNILINSEKPKPTVMARTSGGNYFISSKYCNLKYKVAPF
jgi:hypothetical protein